jgi:hypothetical protein
MKTVGQQGNTEDLLVDNGDYAYILKIIGAQLT